MKPELTDEDYEQLGNVLFAMRQSGVSCEHIVREIIKSYEAMRSKQPPPPAMGKEPGQTAYEIERHHFSWADADAATKDGWAASERGILAVAATQHYTRAEVDALIADEHEKMRDCVDGALWPEGVTTPAVRQFIVDEVAKSFVEAQSLLVSMQSVASQPDMRTIADAPRNPLSEAIHGWRGAEIAALKRERSKRNNEASILRHQQLEGERQRAELAERELARLTAAVNGAAGRFPYHAADGWRMRNGEPSPSYATPAEAILAAWGDEAEGSTP